MKHLDHLGVYADLHITMCYRQELAGSSDTLGMAQLKH